MPEALIASVARSPIGRAVKGSLTGVRPDDLAARMLEAAIDQVPQLDPGEIEDLYLGCGEPYDEQGANMARRVAVLAGLDGLPGATVNRFCSSSLQTTRMAMHAIKAGEGDIFISAGVECVSRYADPGGGGAVAPRFRNPRFADSQARTEAIASANEPWFDPCRDGGLPDIYIGMGQTAENVASLCGIAREVQEDGEERVRDGDVAVCAVVAHLLNHVA